MENIENQKPLNLLEASEYLGLSQSYCYKLTHKRAIKHYKPLGKKIYFLKNDLDEFITKNCIVTQDELDQRSNDYLCNSKGVV